MLRVNAILRRAAAICLIMAMTVSLAALADSVEVKQKRLAVYSKASTSAKKLGAADKGDVLKQKSAKGKWVEVSFGGKTGYVLKDGVRLIKDTKSSAARSTASTAYAQKDAPVYERASTKGKKTASVDKGAAIDVLSTRGKWAHVRVGGREGYMETQHLGKNKPASGALKEGARGEAVVSLQKRLKELGYYTGKADGSYGKSTRDAVYAFQKAMRLSATGTADANTVKSLKSTSARRNPATTVQAARPETASQSTAATGSKTAATADWWTSEIQKVFSRGTVAVVTDVKTGISWKEKRMGGTNHADCQPLTAEDTAKFKRAVGGSWSWDRRAVWVNVGGKTYAASINCMPHGSDSIPDNDFDGHHCIHFLNSRTHSGNRLDTAHQAAVTKAASSKKG